MTGQMMRPIYLETLGRDYATKTFVLEEGSICRVGRSVHAEIPVPSNAAMAESHFLLVHDGIRGRLIDFGGGTQLNGRNVIEAEITEACIMSAGETEFAVLFEDDLRRDGPETPIRKLVRFLDSLEGDLFCLLDAARDERILPLLHDSGAKAMSLYQGESQRQLAHAAPYLVEFKTKDVFIEKLLRYGWGKRWLTLFVSRAGFGGLRKHFRKFLFVSDERGESVYFRFYDPSVLRTFLPVCDSSETQSFFGPIDCFLTESENCSEVIVFEVNNGAVERRIEPLGRP